MVVHLTQFLGSKSVRDRMSKPLAVRTKILLTDCRNDFGIEGLIQGNQWHEQQWHSRMT